MKKSKTALLVGAGVIAIGGTGLGATASAMNGQKHGQKYSSGHSKIDSSWNWYWNQNRDDAFDAELSAAIAAKYNVETAEAAEIVETVRDNQFNVLNDERQATLDEALNEETITQEQYDTIVGHFNDIDVAYDKIDDADRGERWELWKDIKSGFSDLEDYLDDEEININLGLETKNKHHGHYNRSNKSDQR